jgi:hypothetical protein
LASSAAAAPAPHYFVKTPSENQYALSAERTQCSSSTRFLFAVCHFDTGCVRALYYLFPRTGGRPPSGGVKTTTHMRTAPNDQQISLSIEIKYIRGERRGFKPNEFIGGRKKGSEQTCQVMKHLFLQSLSTDNLIFISYQHLDDYKIACDCLNFDLLSC